MVMYGQPDDSSNRSDLQRASATAPPLINSGTGKIPEMTVKQFRGMATVQLT